MLNSIEALFKRPKAGRPSKYAWIWDKIVTEQGDKSIPARWVCMRRKVICRELSFDAQRALVNEKGLKIPHLLHRIIFNFLEYARSGVYPDGAKPMTFARTATLTMHNEREWSLGCGMGDSSGLNVYNGLFYTAIDSDTAGISVAL